MEYSGQKCAKSSQMKPFQVNHAYSELIATILINGIVMNPNALTTNETCRVCANCTYDLHRILNQMQPYCKRVMPIVNQLRLIKKNAYSLRQM